MKALIALAIILLPSVAAADDEAVARQHYERGKALVKLGDHRAAIREFELAYQASPRPNRLFDIAQQHRILAEAGAVQDMRLAVDFFERYLKEKPNAEDRVQVEAHVVDLKARIASAEAAARETALHGAEPGPPAKAPVDDGPHASEVPHEAVTPATETPANTEPRRRLPAWAWVVIGVGGAVVVGTAVGVGVGLSQQRQPPDSTLGDKGVHF